jgi:hypothetical protein
LDIGSDSSEEKKKTKFKRKINWSEYNESLVSLETVHTIP